MPCITQDINCFNVDNNGSIVEIKEKFALEALVGLKNESSASETTRMEFFRPNRRRIPLHINAYSFRITIDNGMKKEDVVTSFHKIMEAQFVNKSCEILWRQGDIACTIADVEDAQLAYADSYLVVCQ
jgi:hypothetical protein